MDARVRDAIDQRVRSEWYAASLYMATSARFSNRSQERFAPRSPGQAQDGLRHAKRFHGGLRSVGDAARVPLMRHGTPSGRTERV